MEYRRSEAVEGHPREEEVAGLHLKVELVASSRREGEGVVGLNPEAEGVGARQSMKA